MTAGKRTCPRCGTTWTWTPTAGGGNRNPQVCGPCRTTAAINAAHDRGRDLKPPPPLGPWAAHAACALVGAPDMWFPTSKNPVAGAVLRICRGCPVREACLSHAFTAEAQHTRHGVWGGLTAWQRDRAWDRLTDQQRAEYRPEPVQATG